MTKDAELYVCSPCFSCPLLFSCSPFLLAASSCTRHTGTMQPSAQNSTSRRGLICQTRLPLSFVTLTLARSLPVCLYVTIPQAHSSPRSNCIHTPSPSPSLCVCSPVRLDWPRSQLSFFLSPPLLLLASPLSLLSLSRCSPSSSPLTRLCPRLPVARREGDENELEEDKAHIFLERRGETLTVKELRDGASVCALLLSGPSGTRDRRRPRKARLRLQTAARAW